MNYFALFLDESSYFEKALSLIRLISNPYKYSSPHITLRLFKQPNSRLEYFKELQVTYLNIIEPGYFNIDVNRPPFVVFLRCESEELEEIEYKPDFPLSRLHITLYEGDDITYANELYKLLNERDWHFKLSFNKPKKLSERIIGAKRNHNFPNIDSLFKEIVGIDYFDTSNKSVQYRIDLVRKILVYLYKEFKNEKIKHIESYYITPDNERKSSVDYIDESDNSLTRENIQLSFDNFQSGIIPFIEKPVQDAIYVTPPEYARDMAKCALEVFGHESMKINFGDSAVGTGALFLAIKHLVDENNEVNGSKYEFTSAIGIDIDRIMAREALIRCGKRGLTVIYGDAISPKVDLGSCRNLMLVNPPYNRHEDIPKEYRVQVQKLATEQTGIRIMGDAGLYVYHLLIMDKWLCQNGVAVWLLPSIFLQSRYGEAVRQYLLNNVQLHKLHVYNDKKLQFDNTNISTTIVAFKKKKPEESTGVSFSYGDSVMNPTVSKVVSIEELRCSLANWRRLLFSIENSNSCSDNIRFGDLFDIKRGLATGANSFFVLERNEAIRKGIPSLALKPLLPKARYLDSLIIESMNDGYPDVKPQLALIDCDLDEETIRENYPEFFRYIQTAKMKKENEESIIERHLVNSRHPWYKQERREPPPFLLTYMGRNKKNLPPLYFLLNKSNAVALNTYLLLYPKAWLKKLIATNNTLYETILLSLNKSAERIIAQQTRVYSGGLHKLEPGELKGLPIVDLPDNVVTAFRYER